MSLEARDSAPADAPVSRDGAEDRMLRSMLDGVLAELRARSPQTSARSCAAAKTRYKSG